MRKAYNFIYIVNLLCGFLLFYNFLFVYETIPNFKIPILIIAFVFYLVADILYFRKKFVINKIDLIITGIYITTCILVFIYSVIYQSGMYDIFSMVYFNTLLLVPHILYIVYNILRCYK